MAGDRQYLLERMGSEMTPDEIRRAEFRTSFRGWDRNEVETFLGGVAARLEELEAEIDRVTAAVGEVDGRDLEKEFETVGREVSGILQAAREAAESMRERAALDAARWRSEAMEEAEMNRREAEADAEALRRDAWATGTELLEKAVEASKRMREEAERDVLTIQGEAEREAHRLTSGARREAEELVRNARMDAEKTTTEAAKRRDDIIDQANRQAAAAQERTRALEQRRDELMEELESVRSTLSRLEGSLEEKRETLELSSEESTSVRVVPIDKGTSEDVEHWEPGETVRVVRPDEEVEPIVDIDLQSGGLGTSEIPESPELEAKPLVDVIPPQRTSEREEPEPPELEEEEPEAVDVSEEETSPEPDAPLEGEDDVVGALFDSLRGGGHVEDEEESEPPAPARGETEKRVEEPGTEVEGRDWIEVRDARLLPITNRALRGAKKSLTELQNIALDGLRTDEGWKPSEPLIAETLQAELIAVWAESFAAGHTVAEEMTDSKIKRPPTPPADSVGEFSKALSDAVVSALDEAGEGQRERQAAASRVFRVWRSDEAERRIRELAMRSYQMGVEKSVGADASV